MIKTNNNLVKTFKKIGFRRFDSLAGSSVELPAVVTEPKIEVDTPEQKILDSIFCRDSNGFPRSSWAVLLGKETPEDIRSYIQNNLMTMKNSGHFVDDDKIVAEYQKLDSEFIAECSRNRYESIEQYEQRISDRIAELRKEETFKRAYNDFAKQFKSASKE